MSLRRETLQGLRIDRADEGGRERRVWPWLLGAAVVFIVAIGGWLALGTRAAAVTVAAAREVGAGAAPGAVLNASGYVTARRRATVSAKITGKVTDVLVEEGMTVREGQVLARLDDASVTSHLRLAEAQLEAAVRAQGEIEARLRQARLTLDRARRLAAESVVGQADLDAAQADVDALEARRDAARQDVEVAHRLVAVRRNDLDDTTIRAPFAGVAISKDAQPGEMVSPISAGGGFTRTGICTIVDMSSLEIEVDVNESYIPRVRPGQRVEAVLDAYPDWRIPSRVITSIPAADRQKATVRVRIAFEKLDPRILPDMGIKVAFLANDEPASGSAPAPRVTIPAAAVRGADDRDVVFVVRDGRVERRAIRVGARSGNEVLVLSGLAAGESVVVDGPADLADGDRVDVR